MLEQLKILLPATQFIIKNQPAPDMCCTTDDEGTKILGKSQESENEENKALAKKEEPSKIEEDPTKRINNDGRK